MKIVLTKDEIAAAVAVRVAVLMGKDPAETKASVRFETDGHGSLAAEVTIEDFKPGEGGQNAASGR